MTAPEAGAGANRPLSAAGWMVGAIVSFTAMAVAGRELSAALDTFEIMFYRSAIGFFMVAAALLGREGLAGAATARPLGHAGRNVIHFAAQNLWLYGVAAIPLSQLVALEFTNPIWVALLAPLLLGERLTGGKLGAALLGFVGVLAIARPGGGALDWGHAAGLGAAIGFALTNMATRGLSRTDGMLCILFWMTLSQAAMGLVGALPGGLAWPPPALAPWVLAIGVLGLAAHLCLTRALALAPATVVAPMEFARLPVVALVGLWLYDEPLTLALAAGAALILGANALNLAAGRKAR